MPIITFNQRCCRHDGYTSRRMYFNLTIVLNKDDKLKYLLLDTETMAGPRYWSNEIKFYNNEWTIATKSPYFTGKKGGFFIEPEINYKKDTIIFKITFPNLTDEFNPFYAFTIEIDYNVKTYRSKITEFYSNDGKLYLSM